MKSPPVRASRPSSAAKRSAILAAAEAAFLAGRYDSVTMDDIASGSAVSKQTVYAHFGSKDQLFVELVTSMTRRAGDEVSPEAVAPIETSDRIADELEALLVRQLATVLQPELLQLRRLVLSEVPRFPELARAVHQHGPQRAIAAIARILADLDARGLLAVPNPNLAASQLNWLVMGAPLNDVMFLGDDSIPSSRWQREHVRAAVATFVTAYRPAGSPPKPAAVKATQRKSK